MKKPNTLFNWKYAFYLLAALSLVVMLVLSKDAGISGDEFFHIAHSENVINYYVNGDNSAAVVSDSNTASVVINNDTIGTYTFKPYNLPYYGQSPDTFAAIIYHLFGINDVMAVRHFINTFLGWVAILFAALLARKIGGDRAAILTFILMLISPRFIGHSFNNLKDVPFAAAAIMTTYYIVCFLDNLPTIKWSTAIKLALAIAFGLSVRVGGILFIAFFGLFALVYYIWKFKELKRYFVKTLLWAAGISLTGYILMVIVWPFALDAPVANVKEAFDNMSQFATSLRQVFEGEAVFSDVLPWYYTPKFILMTIPLAVIIGVIVFLILLGKNKKQWFYYFVVLFSFIFPIFWIAINKSNVYGGWRHSMFAYPAMVVCAGLGFNSLIEIIKNKYGKYATGLVFAILCIHPLAFAIRNHPYEVVYFNELEGGVKKAYGNYEMDYYFHSLREATEWVRQNAEKKSDGSKVIVGAWHERPVKYFLRTDTNFTTTFLRYYEMGEKDWDYAIFVTTGINPEQLRNGSYPPKNTIHKVEVDGVPICIVIKREDRSDYLATLQKDNRDSAIALYHKALMYDKRNESAAFGLAQLYLQTNKPDSVLNIMNGVLEYDPQSDQANYYKAYSLFMKGQNNKAVSLCDDIIKHNFKYNIAYSLAAQIKLRQQPPDLAGAESYLLGLIEIERFDNSTMQQLVAIYQAWGLDQRNAVVKVYSALEENARKKGDKKTAQQYDDVIRDIMGGR